MDEKNLQERKKLKKVVNGDVAIKKPSKFARFLGLLVNDDVTNIREYLLYDLLIPTIKDTLNSAIQRSSEMIFYGRAKRKSSGGSWTSYSDSFDDRKKTRRPDPRAIMNTNNIEFDNFDDARRVVAELNDTIRAYGKAYVGDLFDAMGVTGNGSVDWERGWVRPLSEDITYYRGKWILRLPRCEDL